jgi:hypothetical protein
MAHGWLDLILEGGQIHMPGTIAGLFLGLMVGLPSGNLRHCEGEEYSKSWEPCTPVAPKEQQAPDRSRLRYDGRSFEEWRDYLLTELKPQRRVEGLKAMREFAGKGYPVEGVEVALNVIDGHSPEVLEEEEFKPIVEAAEQVFDTAEDAARAVFLRTLRHGTRNQQLFVLKQWERKILEIGPVSEALQRLALCKDEKVGHAAIDPLFLRSTEKELHQALGHLFREAGPETRQHLLGALCKEELKQDKEALEFILKSLHDCDPEVRQCAIFTMGCREFNREVFVPPLVKVVRMGEVAERVAAIEALRRLPPGEDSYKALLGARKDESPEVRKAVEDALKINYFDHGPWNELLQKHSPRESPALFGVRDKIPSKAP